MEAIDILLAREADLKAQLAQTRGTGRRKPLKPAIRQRLRHALDEVRKLIAAVRSEQPVPAV